MSVEETTGSRKQKLYAMRELTRREIKRKYARSYLGIAWSILGPLLNMMIVTFIFSYIFSRDIENYPAYYYVGLIVLNLFSTATTTAMTALKDNRNLLLKSKLPQRVFVLSRVYTALVNFGFSCVAFIFIIIVLKIRITWTIVFFPVDIFFLLLFSTGTAYLLAILFMFNEDVKNIYNVIMTVVTRFAALFYSVDIISPGISSIIRFNPLYTYIKVARDSILYGRIPDVQSVIQMVLWGVGMFLLGRLVFDKNKNRIMEIL